MIAWLLLGLALAVPLTLEELLDGVDSRVPVLAGADAGVASAEAEFLQAQAGFDPELRVGAEAVGGYYPTRRAKVAVGGQTLLGLELEVGWRYGVGDFAAYDGKPETLSAGEIFSGASTSLRDLAMPPETVTLRRAQQALQGKEADRDSRVLAVRLKATELYWTWVMAARRLDIDEELLQIAEVRADGLSRQVELGVRPEVDLLDNDRLLAERRGKVAISEAKLADAAARLSLLLRAPDGTPQPPSRTRVPVTLGPTLVVLPSLDELVALALDAHPELEAHQARVDGSKLELKGARRGVLPDVRVFASVAQDLGGGSASLVPLEVRGGVSLKAGLLWRKQRSDLASARAEVDMAEARRRGRADQVRADLTAAAAHLGAATRAWSQAILGADAAAELARLESRKLDAGVGDLLRVALREEKLWTARRDVAAAEGSWGVAYASLQWALGGASIPARP